MRRCWIMLCCVFVLLSGCIAKSQVVDVNERGCEVLDVSTLKVYDRFFNYSLDLGFDTVISLTAYTDSTTKFNEYYAVLEEKFRYYHQLFDKFNTYEGINNIKTINDQAGIAPVVVDEELMDLLVLSKEWYEKSHGAFDITLGPVLNVWHNYREEANELALLGLDGNVPTYDELQEASEFVGWQYVELDEENMTVYLNHANASLDVGGVAKGYATEKVAQELECMGLTSGIVNAGGNIRTIGEKPNGEAWSVGIQDPNDPESEGSLDSVRYHASMSMVTSGDYQRYYMVDGVRYHHLISPFTLYPADTYRSTSVNIKNSALADILSTAVYVLPYEEGSALLDSVGAMGIWVSDENKAFEAEHSQVINGSFIAVSDDLVQYMYYMK
ncbi:MAG: FAD:protein FMN transferase [Erysipelotrichales bacterium]|nr:FAD:protein FMN transferase [Erysipelotrichales bacterium]